MIPNPYGVKKREGSDFAPLVLLSYGLKDLYRIEMYIWVLRFEKKFLVNSIRTPTSIVRRFLLSIYFLELNIHAIQLQN